MPTCLRAPGRSVDFRRYAEPIPPVRRCKPALALRGARPLLGGTMEKRTRAGIKKLCVEALRRLPSCRETHTVRIGKIPRQDGGTNWRTLSIFPTPDPLVFRDIDPVIEGLRQRYELVDDRDGRNPDASDTPTTADRTRIGMFGTA